MNKVLIVDDSEQNLYLLQSQLKGSGFDISCARNGAEALALARSNPPDIVISDILMPTMDGFTLLREWMQDSRLRDIPLIIYTATYTDPRDEELAMSLGAARFIVKPAEPELLISFVRQALESDKTGHISSPSPVAEAETAYYRMYNETLIRKLEHKMLALEQEIIQRKKAEETLQAKNAELIHFNYTVSHDLKSPLVTIKTFLGYLEQDMAKADPEHVAQDVGYINTAADKMNTLLDELLDLSRIGRVVNPPVEAPLQEIVKDALDFVAGRIAERGVRVQVTEEPVLLYGDRVRLNTVFQGLIDNAVKFMGDQPEPMVKIGAELKDGETVVFVRDNGMGIDPRHKDKIFGLFEKLNPEMEGTGLGLALVKRIVEVHGGRIWVESEGPGNGACFWFSLPCKSSEL